MSSALQPLFKQFMAYQSALAALPLNMFPKREAFLQKANPVIGFLGQFLFKNGIPITQTPKYAGSDAMADLQSSLREIRTVLLPLDGNTTLTMPSIMRWPGMPNPPATIKEALVALDDAILFLGGPGPTISASAAAAASQQRTASAAAAAASQQRTASAAALAAAVESQRLTASAAAAAESQRRTASAAALASQRMTASAAAAAAESQQRTASAAAVAAEQQRISRTLSNLSSRLQGVQTAIQGGGGASGSSANPVASAVAALNSVKLSNIPKEVLTNSAKATVNDAIQMLKQLKEHQKFVSTRVNAAVKAINAAAAKKGGSRKNNFTRSRNGGSRRKRTRSRSRH